jgi:hypothetical protein
VNSRGEWLFPFLLGTNIIPACVTFDIETAS